MRKVLSLAAYRRLLFAYALNELAWGFGSVTLSLIVYRRTGSALGASGFYLCSQFLPALLAPLVVARIDRVPVRVSLPMLYAAESVLYCGLALAVAGRLSVAVVLVLALLDGSLALTARPLARAAAVDVTSAAGLLREANALTNSCFSVCYMVGPAIGGAVVASGGASAALWVDVGIFLAMALALASAGELLPDATPVGEEPRGRLRQAVAYARRRPAIRLLLGLQSTAVVFFAISIPVVVVYSQRALHASASGYGGLLAGWGAGAVAGSLVYARWRRGEPRFLMALGAGLIGAGMVGMAAAPTLALGIVAAVVAGAGNGIETVAARTTLQESTDPRWMALVMSFNESLSEGTPGLGILLGGGVAILAGPRVALAVGGAGALVVAGVVWAMLHPRRGLLAPVSEPQG